MEIVSQWSIEKVGDWIKKLAEEKGIGNSDTLKQIFMDNGISGEKLFKLTDEILRDDLGITNWCLRVDILTAISKLKQNNLGNVRHLEQKVSPNSKAVKRHLSDYFNDNDPPNAFKLLYTLGAEWLYVGRTQLVLSFAEILLNRFEHFGSKMQQDKKHNKIPFSSTIRGAGKSKANQEMLDALKREVKTALKNEHLGFTFQDLLSHSVAIVITFTNATSLCDRENDHSLETRICNRILYSYFVYDAKVKTRLNREGQTFDGFLREFDGNTFDLDHVLEFITSVERKKYPEYKNPILIYLGIDEYQNLKNEALIQLMTIIGRVMCTSQQYLLAPYFTGTEYSEMMLAIKASRYDPVLLPLPLISEIEVATLLDSIEKSKQFPWFQNWRTDRGFRENIERIGSYLRGIEDYFEECDKIYRRNAKGFNSPNFNEVYTKTVEIISNRLEIGSLEYQTLLYHYFLQIPVGREQMIGKYTWQFLEDTGFVCLVELPSTYCVIKMPTVFVKIFGGRFEREHSFFKTFTSVKYWHEWVTFNYHYLPFRESLFKLTKSTMKLKELFAGALLTSSTGEIEVILEDRSCHECVYPFPSKDCKRISCKDGNVTSWDNTSVCLLNAPSANSGDFITTSHVVNSDELIQFHYQTELEHKQRILHTRINAEHVKNQKSRELLPRTPKIRVITIIMVSVDLEQDLLLQDDIIYISKSQFSQFYGEYCEIEANRALPTNINVNIMSYDELTKFDRTGETTSRSLIEERKSGPFMSMEDLLKRVGKLPQYLEIKF